MISFAPQDLFARSWSGATPFGFAPHAPFIGSFHPQIPQGLAPSFGPTSFGSPSFGSPSFGTQTLGTSPWLGGSINSFASSPWLGSSINPLALALQSGYAAPWTGWQAYGNPLAGLPAGGYPDLSSFALARQGYLPGFYPTNFLAGGHPGLLAGNFAAGAGYPTPGFGA